MKKKKKKNKTKTNKQKQKTKNKTNMNLRKLSNFLFPTKEKQNIKVNERLMEREF